MVSNQLSTSELFHLLTIKSSVSTTVKIPPVCVAQTVMDGTAPGPESCTSPSLCWVDGNSTVPPTSLSGTHELQKCIDLHASIRQEELNAAVTT